MFEPANEQITTTSTSHTDADLVIIPAVVRRANVLIRTNATSSSFWRVKGTSLEGVQVFAAQTGQVVTEILLDSSQLFQWKTDTGTITALVSSYHDDLSTEGQ